MFNQSMPVVWLICLWWWSRACERLLTCLPYVMITVIFFFSVALFLEGSTFYIVLVMVTPNCAAFNFCLECTFEFSIFQLFFPGYWFMSLGLGQHRLPYSDWTLGQFLDLLKSTILYLLRVFFFCKTLKLTS